MFDEMEELDEFDATKLVISTTVHSEELKTADGAVSFEVREFEQGGFELEIVRKSADGLNTDVLVIPQKLLEYFHRAYGRAAQVIRQERSPVWEWRKTNPNLYYLWTEEEHQLLLELHANKTSRTEIARQLGRSPAGIDAQLEKLASDAKAPSNSQASQSVPQRESKPSRVTPSRDAAKSESARWSDDFQSIDDGFGSF